MRARATTGVFGTAGRDHLFGDDDGDVMTGGHSPSPQIRSLPLWPQITSSPPAAATRSAPEVPMRKSLPLRREEDEVLAGESASDAAFGDERADRIAGSGAGISFAGVGDDRVEGGSGNDVLA